MNIVENIINPLAPHNCLGCTEEGSLLCTYCKDTQFGPALQLNSNVWAISEYHNLSAQLVKKLKFERAKVAASIIAQIMHERAPPFPKNTLVIPIPTVPSRARQRGYDQAELIAQGFAGHRKLPYAPVLVRLKNTRQVGKDKAQRQAQLQNAFTVRRPSWLKDKSVTLIDDVYTTGATAQAAATAIQISGIYVCTVITFAYKK
jgi:competence protein ComFC